MAQSTIMGAHSPGQPRARRAGLVTLGPVANREGAYYRGIGTIPGDVLQRLGELPAVAGGRDRAARRWAAEPAGGSPPVVGPDDRQPRRGGPVLVVPLVDG